MTDHLCYRRKILSFKFLLSSNNCFFDNSRTLGLFSGIVASTGVVAVPASVYSWVVIMVLPINAVVDPLLYTLSAKLHKKVGFC